MSNKSDYVFSINKIELNRRLTAFTSLLVTLYSSLLFSSLILLLSLIKGNELFFSIFFFILFCIFTISRIAITIFFRSFRQTKIYLNQDYIERKSLKSSDQFMLNKIIRISIKRTCKNTIREICLWFNDGSNIFFDGIENFEDFKKIIIQYCYNAKINNSHEPIDYDSPIFYPILGVILGVTTIIILKMMLNINANQIQLLHVFLTLYISFIGGYFILDKPLTKRYGEKFKITDLISGSILVILSIIILLMH